MSGVDVSTLQINVTSTGVREASNALGGLSTSANNSTKRVEKLTESIEKLMGVQKTASAAATGFNDALSKTTTATTNNQTATQKMLAALEKLNDGMFKLVARANDANDSLDKIAASANRGAAGVNASTTAIKANTVAMQDAHAMARGLTGSLGALWLTYGNMIPLAAGAAIGASFKQMVTVGKDVENTLEGIRVRGQESVESVSALRKEVLELGQGVYGPREVAKAFDTLVMAGLNAKQAMGAIRDALNLATVGGTTIEKSAETLVQIGTALNIDANAYGRIADVIAATAAASMSSVESISEAFKSGSVVGKLYGATLEDIGTSFAMLSNLGIRGSAAGTSLKNFYSVLQGGSEKVNGALKALGMTVDDFKDKDGNFLPLVTVFEKLSKGLDSVSLSNQKLAISMLSNERGAKEIVEGLDMIRKKAEDSADGIDKTTSALEALRTRIAESYGFTAVGAAAMAMTVDAQFKAVKNTFETTLVKAFQEIQPELSLVATNLKAAFNSPEFLEGLKTIGKALAELALIVTDNIGLIASLAAAFLGLKVASSLASSVLVLSEAFAGLSTAMRGSAAAALLFETALGPVGLILGVVTALIVAYKTQKESISETTKTAMNYMDDFNGKLAEEAARLKRQTELMREGKSATEAQTAALREQQLALVALQGQKAIDEAAARRDAAAGSLNDRQRKLYEDAQLTGKSSVGGGLRDKAVNDALAAEKAYTDQVAKSKAKLEEAAKLQQDIVAASKENAAVQAEMNKNTREGGSGAFDPKAGKEAAAAMRALNTESDKYHNKLAEINASIQVQKDLYMSMKEMGPEYEKASDGARKVALYNAQINEILARQAEGRKKVTDAAEIGHLKELVAAAEVQRAWELKNQAMKDEIDGQNKLTEQRQSDIKNLTEEVARWEAKAAAIGGAKEAAAEYTLATLEQAKAQAITNDADLATIAYYSEMIDKQQQLVALKRKVGDAEEIDKARKGFDRLFDKGRALEFGNTFSQSFGKVGKAIDNAGKGLDKYWRRQNEIKVQQQNLDKADKMSAEEKTAQQLALNDMASKNTVDMYATMAGAAASFFDEKTAAYKVAHGIEMGLRAIELADSIQLAMTKMGLLTAESTLKTSVTATSMTLDAADTASSVSASTTKTAASTTAGVAKAFEQMGVWGFIGAAAIIAFMAAMGFSGKGGSGSPPDMSKVRQESQGTGTVLGDDSAKSNSIANALDIVAKNSTLGLEYSGRMLASLRSINDGISGMAAAVAQTTGLRGTSADQAKLGVGSSSTGFAGISFGSQSTTLTDSGLTFTPQNLAYILNGGSTNVRGYQDVHKEKSSWFGLSKSSSDTRYLSDVDASLTRQIDMTIRNLASGTKAAAMALGQSGALIDQELQSFVVNIGDVSLKGLSGDDIQKQLAAVFSKVGDELANFIVPGFQDFQKVGEGSFETVVRLASGVETAQKALANLGIGMIHYTDIVDKQGDVAVELIRQSIAIKESGSNIAELMYQIDGSASDLVDTYKKLVDVRSTLKAMGLATDVSNELLRGADTLDSLASSLSDFSKGFYTEAEQQAQAVSKLKDQFAALGLQMPASKEAFRTLVETLMAGGASSQDMAARVLALSSAFADVADATKNVTDNLYGFKDELQEAYDRESQALQDTIDKMNDFIKSMKTFKESLIMGDMSPLSSQEKYATAMAKYSETYQKAMAGDKDAMDQFQDVANQLLQFSRDVNASGSQYTSDFQMVLKNIDEVMAHAGETKDTATQQLDALNKSVETLLDINQTVRTVAEILADIAKAQGVTPQVNGSHANGLANVPFDGYIAELHKGERVLTAEENKSYNMDYSKYGSGSNDALCAEIKALREEVQELRKSNTEDANRIIGGQFAAAEAGAEIVAEGVQSAAKDTAYAQRTQPTLN